jgi:phage baseplate assembly protein V
MDRLINVLKAQAAALDQAQGQPRFGIITSFDPATYAARVSLQPEGVLTGWLPILSAWMGAGWGLACPPSPGDQVLILPQEGHAEHGVIVGGAYSVQARPPLVGGNPVPSGEAVLFHASGAYLRLGNDGSFVLSAADGKQVTVAGDLVVTGDISDQNGAHETLAALRDAHDQHVHGSVASGDASTSGPDATV